MESQRDGGGQCSRPPAVDELDLIAAADGEAGPEVVAHLAACDHCAGRASAISGLQSALRRRLYRAFCPSSDELLAFHHRMLSDARHTLIAAHLDECPHCAREVRLILSAANEPTQLSCASPAPRRVVAQLLAPAASHGLAALHGAARGGPGSAQYAYRAENLELTLRVARAAGQPGLLAVSGHVATDDAAIEELLAGATANLVSGDVVLAVVTLDELGGFFFDAVQSGEYQLSVRLGDCEVVVEALAV